MDAPRRRYVDAGPGQVHVREAGPGGTAARRPVVCLHMTPRSGWVYERLLAELGRDRVAVAPDTPGYGGSDGPPAPPVIAEYARWLWQAVDGLGLGPQVDLVGYHTGAVIAVEMALSSPARTGRVVMVSAPIYSARELEARRRRLPPPPLDASGRRAAAAYRAFRRWQMPGLSDGWLARSWAEGLRSGERSWWGYRAVFDYPLAERMPRLERPLLVLRPRDDLWRQTARAGAALPPGGRVLDLPGWGHGMLELHVPELSAILRGFLDAGDPA